MKLLLVVYRIDDEEYPELSKKSTRAIEYWIEKGVLELGDAHGEIPNEEQYLEHPTSVVVIE